MAGTSPFSVRNYGASLLNAPNYPPTPRYTKIGLRIGRRHPSPQRPHPLNQHIRPIGVERNPLPRGDDLQLLVQRARDALAPLAQRLRAADEAAQRLGRGEPFADRACRIGQRRFRRHVIGHAAGQGGDGGEPVAADSGSTMIAYPRPQTCCKSGTTIFAPLREPDSPNRADVPPARIKYVSRQ